MDHGTTNLNHQWPAICRTILRGGVQVTGALMFGLLLPMLALFGGSLDLINWGPGLLAAGFACLLLLDEGRRMVPGVPRYSCVFLLMLGLLFLRARVSPGDAAAANHVALLALAATGFLIGSLADAVKSRAWATGLAFVALANLLCTMMHLMDPGWNLIYPDRAGQLPSGLFPHYSYSTAFCLGAAGLLLFRGCNERGWLRAVMLGGAACALLTIPISPSRGGNLALAIMAASAFALLLARAYSKSKPLLGVWLPGIALVVLAVIFATSFVPLINRGTGLYGFYNDGVRLGYWQAAWQISSQHPWLGGGSGSFAWSVYQVMEGLTSDPVMAHNEAFQFAVEYGWPALLAMSALMMVPVVLSGWRFLNRTDGSYSAIAAIGLVAMLFQSNFESILHCAPVVFVAALIVGQVSRSLWAAGCADAVENLGTNGGRQAVMRFLTEVKCQAEAHAAGVKDAVPKLAELLFRSKEGSWRRASYRLAFWTKKGDEESLRNAVVKLREQAMEELGHMTETEHHAKDFPRGWRLARNAALAGIAFPILLLGTGLTRALTEAWEPLYHPERMSVSDRFERLLRVVEKHPGLGMDRDVLSAAWDSLHQFRSRQAREYWANIYQKRILSAIASWRQDPGAALQIAEITGWAGDYRSALRFYDHAIASQGDNESLFMANSFKGQYYFELFVSASNDGNEDRQQYFARGAVDAFSDARKAMGVQRLPKTFEFMCQECQKFLKIKT